MIRFREFLKERWFFSMQSDYGSKPYFDIHKNPSRGGIARLVRNAEYNCLRGILHNKDIYVWDATHDTHYDVDRKLKLNANRTNYITINKDRYASEYVGTGEDAVPIKNHPWVKKTLSKYRFFFS